LLDERRIRIRHPGGPKVKKHILRILRIRNTANRDIKNEKLKKFVNKYRLGQQEEEE
jgi:hypothetical protein